MESENIYAIKTDSDSKELDKRHTICTPQMCFGLEHWQQSELKGRKVTTRQTNRATINTLTKIPWVAL